MASPQRLITAKTRSGEVMTLTYASWAIRNSDKITAIQKRLSVRNKQIAAGKEPYSMEKVVGSHTGIKKAYRKESKKKLVDAMMTAFLKTRLV